MADPTYHMAIWDDPPTYVCQVCNLQGVDKLTIVAHLDTVHSLPAIPTLLAQQVEDGTLTPQLENLRMAEPTYYVTKDDEGKDIYHCVVCEQQGQEHHASDVDLFQAHMLQRHSGAMVEAAKKPEEPPGQSGEHPEHPHGGPPGQTGEHPQGGPPGQEPHPAHPIVLPEEDEELPEEPEPEPKG